MGMKGGEPLNGGVCEACRGGEMKVGGGGGGGVGYGLGGNGGGVFGFGGGGTGVGGGWVGRVR